MFGIELPDFVRFVTQVSLVVVASCSLWGSVFLWKNLRELAFLLVPVMTAAFLVFFLGWLVVTNVLFVPGTEAHEGVAIRVDDAEKIDYIQKGFQKSMVPAALMLGVALTMFFGYMKRADWFLRHADKLFALQLIVSSFVIVLTYTTGSFGNTQIFFWLHNWHSVLTTGTVIVVDFLYIITIQKDELKRVLYPVFPIMSAAIFVGLGLDFAANLLVFEGTFRISPQFFFSQTLVAILVINGALLATKVNDKLVDLVKTDPIGKLSSRTKKIFGLSGAVSIVSWLSITFVDFFDQIELSYIMFMGIYLAAIMVAYGVHTIIENIYEKTNRLSRAAY